MQNWSNLLEQSCLDQFDGNPQCDDVFTSDHIPSVTADYFIDIPQKTDEDMSSKKQLRLLLSSMNHVYDLHCVDIC